MRIPTTGHLHSPASVFPACGPQAIGRRQYSALANAVAFENVARCTRTSAFAFAPAIASLCLAGLLASSLGCGGSAREPVERDPSPPVVDNAYEVDEANRPLTGEELDQAYGRLTSDPDAFVAELEQAPPVRQASLIFVLQRDPSLARERRDLLEKLSTSSHGIVRRAALFALEAVEDNDRGETE